jgi:hypothetical protein
VPEVVQPYALRGGLRGRRFARIDGSPDPWVWSIEFDSVMFVSSASVVATVSELFKRLWAELAC